MVVDNASLNVLTVYASYSEKPEEKKKSFCILQNEMVVLAGDMHHTTPHLTAQTWRSTRSWSFSSKCGKPSGDWLLAMGAGLVVPGSS